MKKAIESLFSAKGIPFNADELDALTAQWEAILSLKGDFGNAPSNEASIGMTHRLKEEDK